MKLHRSHRRVAGHQSLITAAGAVAGTLFESLEGRVLLAADVTSGAALANIAFITNLRDQFRVKLGGGNVAGANGSFGGLRREINWDGVPAQFDAPNSFPPDFFNVNSPRGVVLSTPGTGFQNSSNPADAATPGQPAPPDFGNINPTYTTAFEPFSPTRLFTPIGSNVTDVTFFIPGTNVPAAVTGFGAIFSDVDTNNTTSIEYFDQNNTSLGKFFALGIAGDAALSFLGVNFNAGEQVARVRITTGQAALGPDDLTQGGADDLAVLDEFIYSDPGAFVVTNTSDSGAGSLRQAITNANAAPQKQLISFNIPGPGVQTIQLVTLLPQLTDPVTIDGYTQPGATANTLAVGDDANLLIEVRGSLGSPGPGLVITGGKTTIRGLVLNSFRSDLNMTTPGDAIRLSDTANNTGNVIAGNFIGTDSTGTTRMANDGNGILVGESPANATAPTVLIGGGDPAARNIISGNNQTGITIVNGTATIRGNYVGVDATGAAKLANSSGIVSVSATGATIGGSNSADANVISGNFGSGVTLFGPGNVLQGNFIGTDASGTADLGNGLDGVALSSSSAVGNLIGGPLAADGNVIAFNGGAGVDLSGVLPQNNTIRRNSIYSNGNLGITLQQSTTPLPNDLLDADLGANGLQNYPVLASATSDAISVAVQGVFFSAPNRPYLLDFYANDAVDPSGFGEGKTYIGSIGVATDPAGNAVFNGAFPASLPPGQFITATATDAVTGATSEFSAAIDLSNPLPPPPPTLSINDVSLAEGNSGTTSFVFTVTRSGDLSAASDVLWSTANQSATVADNDYQPVTNAPLHFAACQASAQITVLVNGDTKQETNETFLVNLFGASGATIADGQGIGTIQSDEAKIIATGKLNLEAAKKPKGSFTGVVASFTDPDFSSANNFDATINWGDGTSSAGQIVFNAQTQQWDIIGTHAYAKKGTFTLLITIADDNGATATATSKLKA
jgi:hypothetical protein